MSQVSILLSSYQGEKFLDSQLRSILNQTFSDFKIFIRDDGSQDKTLEIVQGYAAEDARIIVIPSSGTNLGVKRSFSELIKYCLEYSPSKWIFFSDQDDVWDPKKIAELVQRMKHLEDIYDEETPILIHSDLEVIDSEESSLSKSFWAFSGISPRKALSLNRIITQNPVTGCAMVVNRALLNKVGSIPDSATMHDAWIALVAAAFGVVEPYCSPLVRYRQHASNVLGASAYSWKGYFFKGLQKLSSRRSLYFCQAKTFYELYHETLAPVQLDIVDGYMQLHQVGYIKARSLLIKYQFFKPGFFRNICHLLTPFKCNS